MRHMAIVIEKNKIVIIQPMGAKARTIVSKLREYGIVGEVKEWWCG